MKTDKSDRCHLMVNVMHALRPGELLEQKEMVQGTKGQM